MRQASNIKWGLAVRVALAFGMCGGAVAAENRSADEHFRHALSLLLNPRVSLYEDAAAEFTAFIAAHPADARIALAHYWLAESFLKAERYADALREHALVAERHPECERHAESLFRVGELSHRLLDYAAAVKANAAFLERYPKHELSEAVLSRDTNSRLALLQSMAESDAAGAVELARQEAGRNDAVAQGALYLLSALLFNRGDFKGAVEAAEAFLKRFPHADTAEEVRFTAGSACVKLDENERALAHLKEVKTHRAFEAAYLRGAILLKLQRTDEALKEFAVAADAPEESSFWKFSVFELGRAGDLEARERLIGRHPGSDLADRTLCLWASEQIEAGLPAEALKTLARLPAESALREEASRLAAGASYRLGLAQEEAKEVQSALATYDTIVKNYPTDTHAPFALLRIGALTIDTDRNRAIEALTRVIDGYPAFERRDQAAALISYGRFAEAWAAYEAGRYAEAAPLFAALTEDKEHGADAIYLAALCHQRLNNLPEQEALFDKLLAAHPQFKHARDARQMLGEALIAQRKWQEAATFFEEAAKLAETPTERAEAQLKSGMALYNVNQLPRALDFLVEAEREGEPYVKARAAFMIGQIELNRRNFEEARRHFLKVAVLYEHEELTPASLFEAAKCMRQLGEHDKARQLLEALLKDYPKSAVADAASAMLQAKENVQ